MKIDYYVGYAYGYSRGDPTVIVSGVHPDFVVGFDDGKSDRENNALIHSAEMGAEDFYHKLKNGDIITSLGPIKGGSNDIYIYGDHPDFGTNRWRKCDLYVDGMPWEEVK